MPIRPLTLSRGLFAAAAFGLALPATADQPRFPVPPPAQADDAPLQDDAVPKGVVPVDPTPPTRSAVPTPPAAIAPSQPVPSDTTPLTPVPDATAPDGPPSDLVPAPPVSPVPPAVEPSPLGPPPDAFPVQPWPSAGPFGRPPFHPWPSEGGPSYGAPSVGGMPGPGPSPWWVSPPRVSPVPANTPPADPPVLGTLPSVPGAGANANVPMRPEAPLAPLPPVGADPTLGPPPGTLGHTYWRPSRYIPWDEHPRVGMIDLTLLPEWSADQGPGRKIRVTVQDVDGQLKPLEGYVGDDKHWHFESEPLIPGLPHVYRVKVERVLYENQQIRRYGRLVEQEVESGSEILGVRYLRLIPGRIVTLEF